MDKGYLMLFNAITDLIAELQELQRRAEELFVGEGD
jgi:hypothetical protein